MERLKERVAHIGQYAVTLLKWMVLGGVIGLVGGIIGSLFHIGVDTATRDACVNAGANVLVAGSAVYKAADIPAKIKALREG